MKFRLICPQIIKGTIDISGSKNACLPIIAGALLSKEEVIIYNVPLITDIISMIRILDDLGVEVKYDYHERKLTIHANKITKDLTCDYVTKLRASYYLISPLIHRKKEVITQYPGGCNFGDRPIDIHLELYRKIGLNITEGKFLILKRKKLHPVDITFSTITVGGTINAILSSVLIKGTTTLTNIAIEPEVIDVINFLISMGANIKFLDKRKIEIKGVKKLHKTTYKVMPDRIEAGSYILLALAKPNSQIIINNVVVEHLKNIIDVVKVLNAQIEIVNNSIKVSSQETLNSIAIKTGPYPDFPTDLQPLLSTILLRGNSTSQIMETIYPTRDSHIKELKRMGGNISICKGMITIKPSHLINGVVSSHDLRCGFAMIIAGVMTEKHMIINHSELILRGYESILDKLSKLNITCQKER